MTDNIYILGDIHGNWKNLNNLLFTKFPDIVLQCGDFGYWPHMYDFSPKLPVMTKLYWCAGNHENWDMLDEWNYSLLKNREMFPNLYYMPRCSYITLPNKMNVLFFGGAESIDKDNRILGVSWWKQEIPGYDALDNLPDINIDIVISHTCPLEFDIGEYFSKENDPTRRALSIIFKKYNPKYWAFGHWHTFKKGIYNQCKWICLNENSKSYWWMKLKDLIEL